MKDINISDQDFYEIFVKCGGKCGSSTLCKTFLFNNYKTFNLHHTNDPLI